MLSIIFGGSIIVAALLVFIAHWIARTSIWDTIAGLGMLIVMVFTIVIAIVVVPLATHDHYEYIEIENATVIRTENSVVIDLVNSEQNIYPSLFKFDRYQSVMDINDSTKYYLRISKSFYGVTQNSQVLWINPPYEIYNIK